jgi:hypothetical protein
VSRVSLPSEPQLSLVPNVMMMMTTVVVGVVAAAAARYDANAEIVNVDDERVDDPHHQRSKHNSTHSTHSPSPSPSAISTTQFHPAAHYAYYVSMKTSSSDTTPLFST